jgi:transcription elongation factor GreB
MGRWRPPQAPSSTYITASGYAALQSELQALWQRRPSVVTALAAAAAEGDRSENAEYTYRKRELAGIDRRIRFLQRRLPQLTIVDRPPDDRQRIFFGAWVTLEDEAGNCETWRIVGPDEITMQPRYISMDGVLARTLLGKPLDHEFEIETPGGRRHWLISAIDYEPPTSSD